VVLRIEKRKRKGRWGGHAEPPRWPSPSTVELRPAPSSSRVLSRRHERGSDRDEDRKGLKGEQRGEDAGRGLQPSPVTRRRRAGRRRSASSSHHERTEIETGE
jgi:hypothetical protein